ncbi:poly-beta-1,6 N-acetyl-D-glucosamine export porin PgaA [Halopseudomonas sp.]|uniref:poly-beta-1,6 N-acetyl-D-glucosamine export porin PgaA n=1 Tax=Halopseudomonas sp. TaxID=2901191 RepID=UPI0035638EB4
MPSRSVGKLALACFIASGIGICGAPAFAAPSYAQLVEQARRGDQAAALEYLRALPAPTAAQRLDHLLIAGWAGKDDEVIRLYEQNKPLVANNPDAVAAMARARRNRGEWSEALNGYHLARSLAPERNDFHLSLLMTMADMGQTPAAIRRARVWLERAPDLLDARLALGYALMRDGQQHAALAEYDRAHDMAPGRSDVLREYIFALQRSGLPVMALRVAEENRDLIAGAEFRAIRGDILAERVRLADTASRAEHERFMVADRALQQADALGDEWQNQPAADADLQRVRVDRLGALHARVRMAEVVAEYRRFQAEQSVLPPYALRWVASALLYTRQPAEAAELYRRVIAAGNSRDPLWIADHQGLYFSLIESEQLSEADDLSKQLAAAQPARLYPLGIPQGRPNNAWLDSQSLLANNSLYRDDLPAAQQAFEQLSDAAPGNVSLRTSRASVYAARGWPRRAEQELKIAESTSPRSLEVEAGQGFNALSLQEWRQADDLADDLIQRLPESLTAQRLERARQVHHMAELRLAGYRGSSSDDSISGAGDLGLEAVVYSEPMRDAWRLFAGGGFGRGEFQEGSADHRWLRAGVEHRIRDHTLEAEVSRHDFGYGNRLGGRLSGTHDINDLWQYGWSAELLSAQTPLRALNSDIDADSLSAFVRWRASEQREVGLSVSPMQFSDGNDRFSVVLDGRQRLYTAPRLLLDLGAELSASSNSQGDEGPYFNPQNDLGLMATLNLSHILRRHYESIWSHDLQVGVGHYSQNGFDGGAMGLVGYGQRIRFNSVLDAGFVVSALSRPYDGEREREYRLVLDLNFRFEGL